MLFRPILDAVISRVIEAKCWLLKASFSVIILFLVSKDSLSHINKNPISAIIQIMNRIWNLEQILLPIDIMSIYFIFFRQPFLWIVSKSNKNILQFCKSIALKQWRSFIFTVHHTTSFELDFFYCVRLLMNVWLNTIKIRFKGGYKF